MPIPPPDIEAEIRFLTSDEGGRQAPVRTGYRPNHDFGGEGTLNDAVHEYPDREWVSPGETVDTRLAFMDPDAFASRLHEGFEFTVQEGARIVGRGRITKVLNMKLARTEK